MNRNMLRVTVLALTLLTPLVAAEGGPWAVRTANDGTTYAIASLVRLEWPADREPTTPVHASSSGIPLFSLALPMEDLRSHRQPTYYETEDSWFKVGVPPEPVRPRGDVSLLVHDVARLAGTVQCMGHPPEPVIPAEPCAVTFPEGSILTFARDGNTFEVQLPRQEDRTPGPKLSWVGFNPQPEPPAIGWPWGGIRDVAGTTVWFTGSDIQVTVAGVSA